MDSRVADRYFCLMNTLPPQAIVNTNLLQWEPLIEEGIDTTGIKVKKLRFDPDNSRYPAILLQFAPGSAYPYHNHPAGEEIFVLEGSCFINDTMLTQGDYLYTPSDYKHSVRTSNGCTLLLIIPEEVQILQ